MTEATNRDTRERYGFGKNWRSFLQHLDAQRIDIATTSMRDLLSVDDLAGLRFLDIGSGSGLFSLAAHRLGADVVSFDYDIDSVECTRSVQRDHGHGRGTWSVLQGSVLDPDFMAGLGEFDLVYSWGVLHHTGDMDTAISLAARRVRPGGRLVLAIYNDQGFRSRVWLAIKRFYCRGKLPQLLVECIFFPIFLAYGAANDLLHLRWPGRFMKEYVANRGMSVIHDWRDWLGGLPFEVATPAGLVNRPAEAGLATVRMRTTRGLGCNEFVYQRLPPAQDAPSATGVPTQAEPKQ